MLESVKLPPGGTDLPPSTATLACSFQVHPKIMQERLGHSSVAITTDILQPPNAQYATEAVALVDGVSGRDR